MSISAAQYNGIVKDWLKTSEGKAHVEEYGGFNPYSEEDMRAMAEELYTAIVNAYKAEVKTRGADYFDMSTIRVGKPTKAAKGKTRLRITFNSKGLSRRSLHVRNERDVDQWSREGVRTSNYYRYDLKNWGDTYFTGSGVYDIFGLFTQGYATKAVYGEWWDNESDNGEAAYPGFKGRSLPVRVGSDFITRTVNEFKRKYPSVEVEYPRLWGGTK